MKGDKERARETEKERDRGGIEREKESKKGVQFPIVLNVKRTRARKEEGKREKRREEKRQGKRQGKGEGKEEGKRDGKRETNLRRRSRRFFSAWPSCAL